LRRIRFLLFACLLLAACGAPPTARVLFIGNSYTFVNGGLDHQLAGLARTIETKQLAIGGYSLEQHWTDGQDVQVIRQGGWNDVVLQDQSQTPVFDATHFDDALRKFDKEIRAEGGQTVLLMTWERPDSVAQGVTTANLAAAYQAMGGELGALVAPAGLAFARSLQERPDLVLYSQDGHPTQAGTYLAACVLYGTIFKQTPVGNAFADWNMPADERDYLQRVAAETLGY
jgi:hypothetical protein